MLLATTLSTPLKIRFRINMFTEYFRFDCLPTQQHFDSSLVRGVHVRDTTTQSVGCYRGPALSTGPFVHEGVCAGGCDTEYLYLEKSCSLTWTVTEVMLAFSVVFCQCTIATRVCWLFFCPLLQQLYPQGRAVELCYLAEQIQMQPVTGFAVSSLVYSCYSRVIYIGFVKRTEAATLSRLCGGWSKMVSL